MTETYGLTRTQRETLLVIQELSELGSVAPTLEEIAHELCMSSRGRAHAILRALRDRGYVSWLPHRARSITVLLSIPPPNEYDVEVTPAGIAAARRMRRQ